jgi:hypothetical protein
LGKDRPETPFRMPLFCPKSARQRQFFEGSMRGGRELSNVPQISKNGGGKQYRLFTCLYCFPGSHSKTLEMGGQGRSWAVVMRI